MAPGLERLFTPSFLDIASPFVAFILVIALPSVFAFYVMWQVLSGRYRGEN